MPVKKGVTVMSNAAVNEVKDFVKSEGEKKMKNNQTKSPIWDSKECALVLIDYQPEVMDSIHDKDPKLVELNVRALAQMAVKFEIPVVLSTVAVKLGVDSPT